MSGHLAHIIGRLVIALGLILGGSGPLLASSHAMPAMTAMVMMPAMAMDHDGGSTKQAPAKQLPCGSQECGCCAACSCAPPPALVQIDLLKWAASPDTIAVRDDAAGGITFPPSLRPPIAV